ncbi:5' nucleotidase, NT5C type [Namhaeicola litoreus]|uniref:Uncharacterized protein n=1 Tax=Namhaeicola litoreus TaxID=1052145 RepID=A0ABW3Y256_9FLAO
MMKKTLYIDMDNVLVDFPSAFAKIDKEILTQYEHKDDIPGIFALMDPVEDAIESIEFLAKHFEVYILSTAPWENPSAWRDKLLWIKKHLPEIGYKRLILSHNKHLNIGDYIIDDRTKNGVDKFQGRHLHFGEEGDYKSWKEVVNHLCEIEKIKNK